MSLCILSFGESSLKLVLSLSFWSIFIIWCILIWVSIALYLIILLCGDDLDWLVLAASLEVGGPPGLLLAEAHDGLGPMVLLPGGVNQQ